MSENKFAYVIDSRKPIKYPDIEGWDENIVETAGFIPLAVRFKQMEQAGYRARFNESEFSSRDITDMYLNHPEYDIQPDDDFEEAQEKFELRQAYIKEIQKSILQRKQGIEAEKKETAERTAEKKVEKNEVANEKES